MEGWIKLHRKIVDTPLWISEPFSRSQAWIDLLILANSSDGFFFKRGIRVDVKRGQIGHDLDTLAKKWKWSRGKVNRFISMLEMDRQIVRQKTNVTTLITILNYNTYQSGSKANDITDSKTNGHQTIEQTDTNKNNKKEKKEKKIFVPNINTWENDFEIYLSELKSEYHKIINDVDFIKKQEKFYPNADIKLSIENAYENYWKTEQAWHHKKSKKPVPSKINWQSTLVNSIKFNSIEKSIKKDKMVR